MPADDDDDGPRPGIDAPIDDDPTFGERPDAEYTNVHIDTTLASDEPTGPARGGTDFLEIDADPESVTLMRFELSAVPTTATVVSARLEVTVFDPLENGIFEGHAVLAVVGRADRDMERSRRRHAGGPAPAPATPRATTP